MIMIWNHGLHTLVCIFTCLCVFLCVCPSIEETCIELSHAIEAGDMQSASAFAATLAQQHATLKIQPSPRDYEDNEIRCGSWFYGTLHKGVWSHVNKHCDPLPCIWQPGSCSWGFFVILLCHREGFSTHDHCSSETTGKAGNCTLSLFVLFDKGALNHPKVLLPHVRCFWSMAFTLGCSAGWSASACVLTSAPSPHMEFIWMATLPSSTCFQPAMLAWLGRFSSKTRRVPFLSVLHLCLHLPPPSLLPLQMAPHHWTGGLTAPCLPDSILAAILVSSGFSIGVSALIELFSFYSTAQWYSG